MVVEACQFLIFQASYLVKVFDFSDKLPSFSQITELRYLIEVNKNRYCILRYLLVFSSYKKNQSVKANFILTTGGTFKKSTV